MADSVRAVHPVADLFPMMTDDELADLAADISANGLIHPIVIDDAGQLIDGRNRLAACALAGVEPTFTTLNGHDPVAFILSANVTRRHLSKGQAAMVVAQARLISKQQTQREAAASAGVNAGRVGQAEAVLTHAPDLADAVQAGATSLDEAYAEARKRKEAARSHTARLAELQAAAPDLATLVVEERLSLPEAMRAWQVRKGQLEQQRMEAHRRVTDILKALKLSDDADPAEEARTLLDLFEPPRDDMTTARLTPERLRRSLAFCAALIDGLDQPGEGA